MTDESTERVRKRRLTAGGPQVAQLLAAMLLFASYGLFYGLLGFEGIGLIWIPTLGAILLSVPLYFLLRTGDGLLNRWWERRAPDTRLVLRRFGWGAGAALAAVGGVFLVAQDAGEAATGINTAAGLASIAFGAWLAVKAVREKRRGA